MTIAYFSKEVTQLIDGLVYLQESESDWEFCHSLLQSAQKSHQRSTLRARSMRLLVGEDETLQSLAERQERFLDERNDLYHKIQQRLEAKSLEELAELNIKLQDLSFQVAITSLDLERGRAQQAGPVKFRPLAEVLQLSQSPEPSKEHFELLAPYVPELLRWHKSELGKTNFFLRYHKTEEQIGADWAEADKLFQNGMGALVQAIENRDKEALKDAHQLLAGAAQGMELVQTGRESVRAEGLSSDPLLEAFALVTRRASRGRAEVSQVKERLASLKQFLKVQKSGCSALMQTEMFHPKKIGIWEKKLAPALDKVASLIEKALELEKMAALERVCNELFRAAESFRKERETWSDTRSDWRNFDREESWSHLREALLGWYQGLVPEPTVQHAFLLAHRALKDLLCRVSLAPELDQKSLREALEKPLDLFLEMEVLLRQQDGRTALPKLLVELENNYDRFLWARDSLTRFIGSGCQNVGDFKSYLERCQKQVEKAADALEQLETEDSSLVEQLTDGLEQLDLQVQELLDVEDSDNLKEHQDKVNEIEAIIGDLLEAALGADP